MTKSKKGFPTRAIHSGQKPEALTGSVITPIFQTSTYVQKTPGEHSGYEYSRTGNPTRTALETCLADLEDGVGCSAFSSGMGAITTFLHTLEKDSHVICGDDVYGGTLRLFSKVMKDRALSFSFVSMLRVEDIEASIRNDTKAIWVETPTNPLLQVVDIEALASLAKKHSLTLVVDNTFASPYLQRPLNLGADVVLHSTTKYIGGHSDVIGGAIISKDQNMADQIAYLQNSMGAVPGPMDSWLTLRGLKTLAIRMDKHCENAQKIVEYLQTKSEVKDIIYPGLEEHPQYVIAKKQMSNFGGMISMRIKGGEKEASVFMSKLSVFLLAESLGGVESLIEHPGIMTHASVPKEKREAAGIGDNLIRLSVGIESVQDLIDDLEQGFASL